MFWSAELKSTRMIKKMMKLNRRGKYEAVVNLADEIYELYFDSEDPYKRSHAKVALNSKAISLVQLEKYQDAILTCDQIIDIFTHSRLPEDIENEYRLEYIRAAYRNKALSYYSLRQYDKAIELIDSRVDEYIHHTDSATEYLTINMLMIKAECLKITSENVNDRLAVFNKIVNRFQISNDPDVLDIVISTLSEMLIICVILDDYKNALVLGQIARQLDSRADQVKVQRIITSVEQFEMLLEANKEGLMT